LDDATKKGSNTSGFSLDMNTPVQILEMEHEQAGEEMSIIRVLTHQYTPPLGACSSYTILYEKLKEFETNLLMHVHLENNILFPKAIQIEKDLLSGTINSITENSH
jgi:regulator of cell morphogenesis and NO signaling